MRSETYFDVELETTNGLAASKTIRLHRGMEVLSFAKEHLQPNIELLVACVSEGADLGNLIIEVDAQGSCKLRALEHRGFVVNKVSVEQALFALQYWLPSQEKTPRLQWEDE